MTANSSVLATSSAGAHGKQQDSNNSDSLAEASASNADALAPLTALCAMARFHQVAADPATLAHQLGLTSSDQLTSADVLRAAQHLGLKAKLTRTSASPLPEPCSPTRAS